MSDPAPKPPLPNLGPSTAIPHEMMRPNVLLCLGEEPHEVQWALDAAGAPDATASHRHRTFHAVVRDDVLCIDGGLGSPMVEKALWELLGTERVDRLLLVGTAGSLDGFSGEAGRPYLCDPATSVYQNFDVPPGASWSPTLDVDLPRAAIVSSDRFYGFSHEADRIYPAEPGLLEAWDRHRGEDALVDMEVAAFYHFCEQFDREGRAEYAAIKAAANRVADLPSLPQHSARTLNQVVAAAWPLLCRSC